MDALYFRVSSHRHATENQFEDLVKIAKHDRSGRDWTRIRDLLAQAVVEEERKTSTGQGSHSSPINPALALAVECVSVERGKSGRMAVRRPLYEHMKRDPA